MQTPKFRLYYPKQGEREVPIMETTNKYLDLSGAISLSKSVAAKAITIVNTKQGVRTRLSSQLWKDLGKPEQIEVFLLDDKVVITEAQNPDNALPVGDKRYIYGTGLAKKLAELAGVDFKARKSNGEPMSAPVGSYEMQPITEELNGAVISFS
jgi:hypothetical protein